MKKASKILLLIGGIFGILACVSIVFGILVGFGVLQLEGWAYAGMGIFSLLCHEGVIPDMASYALFPDETIDVIYIVVGVFMLITSFVVVISCIVSFIVHLVSAIIALVSRDKKEKKGLYIANLIFAGVIFLFFGVDTISLIAEVLIIVGSIFGLIALQKAKAEGSDELPNNPEIVEYAE